MGWAAEFTGRARWVISSTAPTPTAGVAEGSSEDETFLRSGASDGLPPRLGARGARPTSGDPSATLLSHSVPSCESLSKFPYSRGPRQQ